MPPFDLEFDLKDDLEIKNKCDFRDQHPKLDLGTQLRQNLNLTLNKSMNMTLTSHKSPGGVDRRHRRASREAVSGSSCSVTNW